MESRTHYVVEGAYPEFHAVFTIQLGQLIKCGEIDFTSDAWDIAETEHIKKDDFWKKFERRFFWREIGMLPYGRWRWELLRKIDDILPKYEPLFAYLANGGDILADATEYGKRRDIFSDFPQTQLSGINQDYASTGNDTEFETVRNGSWFDNTERFATYNDVWVMLMNELDEFAFMQIASDSINGF